MRTRNFPLLIAGLGLSSLIGVGVTGCDGGEILNNPDDRPQILSVRFVDEGNERETSAGGQQVQMVDQVVGPRNSCRTGDAEAVLKDIRLAVYMSVPNTQAEMDVDAFFALVEQKGLFKANPASIKSVERSTVVYNTPGSAEGVTRTEVQLSFREAGNFIASPTAQGAATSGSSTVLTDDLGRFLLLGVGAGSIVQNRTDGSIAVVTQVFGDNSLEHSQLVDGANNTWAPGDEYFITNATLCEGSSVVFYDYALQVVVVDSDFRGDSISLPITVVDNTSLLCKASSALCPNDGD